MKQNVLFLLGALSSIVCAQLPDTVVDPENTVPKREHRIQTDWSDKDNEYQEIYLDLDYTPEEMWVDRAWEKHGIVQMTDDLYDKYISPHKEGDKTWLIIVGKSPYQNHESDPWADYNRYGRFENWFKKLIAFKMLYGDEYLCAFIDEGTHEHLKESFPHSLIAKGDMVHRKLPYMMMIRDGRVYYREPTQINQLGVHSFVDRDFAEARIQSHIGSRVYPQMIYWEYIQTTVSATLGWRKIYTDIFNWCSRNLEDPHRQECRDFLKDYFGPLVPNKTQGARVVYIVMTILFIGAIFLRIFITCFRKHVLLIDDEEEEEEEVVTPQSKKQQKPNSGSRREKLD